MPEDGEFDELEEISRHLKVLERSAPLVRLGPAEAHNLPLERAALPRLLAALAPRGLPQGPEMRKQLEDFARKIVSESARTISPPPSQAEIEKVTRNVTLDVLGTGPIQVLLDDPDVTEIMVNGPETVLVERDGRVERTGVRFRDVEHLTNIVRKLAERIDRRIDFQHPTLDARLADGSRAHAILPPIALDGPVLTIRKYRPLYRQIEDLVSVDTLRPEMAYYLGACVKARLNIAVGGPSSSGKTTTLNVLASQIPTSERVVTIEELAELDLTRAHGHIVRLQAREDNTEGAGAISIRSLIREALRMRADRIIVGEARGAEMLDVLQAMRCGHDGSMTTIHATSERDLIERATTISLYGNPGFEGTALRRMVVDALDVCILLERFSDGQRKVAKITEPWRDDAGEIHYNDVFVFDHEGYDGGKATGRFRCVGPSRFLTRFKRAGLDLPAATFEGLK